MIRHCDGTDPNLIAEDGRAPCACGLRFDDVDRSVIYPHHRVGARVTVDAGGEVWAWAAPREGQAVPDYAPQLLGVLTEGFHFRFLPSSSDQGEGAPEVGSNVCVRCRMAFRIGLPGDSSEWVEAYGVPADCDHITKDGRR